MLFEPRSILSKIVKIVLVLAVIAGLVYISMKLANKEMFSDIFPDEEQYGSASPSQAPDDKELTSKDLLPKDNSLEGIQFLYTDFISPESTRSSSLKNPNMQLRADIPIQYEDISYFNKPANDQQDLSGIQVCN